MDSFRYMSEWWQPFAAMLPSHLRYHEFFLRFPKLLLLDLFKEGEAGSCRVPRNMSEQQETLEPMRRYCREGRLELHAYSV